MEQLEKEDVQCKQNAPASDAGKILRVSYFIIYVLKH
jgi:hypothetical protein